MAILKTHRNGYIVLTTPAARETDNWSPQDLRDFLQGIACRVGSVRTSTEASEALAYLNWRSNKRQADFEAQCQYPAAFVLLGGDRCHCDNFTGNWSR